MENEMTREETLGLQVAEVEMLTSMFPTSGEFVLDDPTSVAQIQQFLDSGGSDECPDARIGFTIKLNVGPDSQIALELVCRLPLEYPAVEPDIFLRAPSMSRMQHQVLTESLQAYIHQLDRGEICIGQAIEWINDNVDDYITPVSPAVESPSAASTAGPKLVGSHFTRMWIYSHHLYSKIKRKDILDLAAELRLSGFSLPGKPGVIVIEGYSEMVEVFWGTVRRWQWKKITMKEKEDFEIGEKRIDEFRKFDSFKEMNFDARPGKGRGVHMDLGQLYNFLEERGCGAIFHIFFGVDGKSQVEAD